MSKFVGKKAPEFELKDSEGKLYKLSDYKGKKVLVYFYPRDMTHGCTLEAQNFRDHLNDLKKLKVQVLGISADSVDSHKKFCEKEKLNFPILSDEKRTVIKKYGAWKEKSLYGRFFMGIARESFLIDEKGKVIKHYEKVSPAEHVHQVIADVSAL